MLTILKTPSSSECDAYMELMDLPARDHADFLRKLQNRGWQNPVLRYLSVWRKWFQKKEERAYDIQFSDEPQWLAFVKVARTFLKNVEFRHPSNSSQNFWKIVLELRSGFQI